MDTSRIITSGNNRRFYEISAQQPGKMQGICIRQVLTPCHLFAKRLLQMLMRMGCPGKFHIPPPVRQAGQGESDGNAFSILVNHLTVDPAQ